MSRANYNTMSSAHSTSPSLHLRHNSFSNLSVALPTSQPILQAFRCFNNVTVHSTTFLLSLLLRHSSFYNTPFASPTSQFILQPFFRFTYVTVHSTTLLSLLLRHRLFTWRADHDLPSTNSELTSRILQPKCLSVTSPTSQLILQPFHRFIYFTAHSPSLPLLHLRHSSFSNPSFASPTSQALHLIHLVSRP